MTYVITGATGHLGRLVVESLLARGVPAGDVVATGRAVDTLADLADRGVQVRHADYEDPESLRAAFAGADRVLFVSASEPGRRIPQHRNVIAAAEEAGVALLTYTSIPNADGTSMLLAADHQETEALLAASGLPYALLRNGWYLENYTGQLASYLEHGAVLGSAGEGRVSAATRADLADAAAEVLLRDDQAGAVYELGGDEAFTLAELAAVVGEAAGREVAYQDLPVADYTAALVAAGLPEGYAAVLADSDRGLAAGDLLVTTGDLTRLIGRPTTTLREAVRAAVRERASV
ncbi:SDR family oxidoreductase [Mumia sp. DW29H23]|uniref:SDR family oxidoreductase n=1 Tax=Mumia sp. DW29H23 TaxID=3421241 RepID=UPI003D694AE5